MYEAVLLATRSAGKMRELMPLLAAEGVMGESLSDAGIAETADEDSLEVYETFAENALAKARWFSRRSGGRVVIADDSGLVVDALDGRPGVHSKRWAGANATGSELDTANNAYLRAELRRVAEAGRVDRRARYVCAAACVWSDGERVALGSTVGELLATPRGDGGFGYDPYFMADELGLTFAEVSREVKAGVSHRGRAVRALLAGLREVPQLRTKLFRPVDPEHLRG